MISKGNLTSLNLSLINFIRINVYFFIELVCTHYLPSLLQTMTMLAMIIDILGNRSTYSLR